jgi:hypothetical protein
LDKAPVAPKQEFTEFIFRGNAVAAGGFLTRLNGKQLPSDRNMITTHGESSLPLIGGVSHSVVQPRLPFGDFINYGTCETFVWGRHVGDATVTTLSASVVKVRLTTSPSPEDKVPDVQSYTFEAERITIEVESTHPRQGQPSFKITKAEASGLSLSALHPKGSRSVSPIQIEFDQALMAQVTMEQLDEQFLTNRQFFDEHAHLFPADYQPVFGKSRMPRTPQGYFSGSIVKQIRVGEKVTPGNVLVTKGFGTITFGRLLADEISRRISMVRVKMGSDPGGDVGFSGVETNGIWN